MTTPGIRLRVQELKAPRRLQASSLALPSGRDAVLQMCLVPGDLFPPTMVPTGPALTFKYNLIISHDVRLFMEFGELFSARIPSASELFTPGILCLVLCVHHAI